MCRACAVCKCVVIGEKRGVGETWLSPSWRLPSSQELPLYSLSLSACWCRRSSCSTHAIVLPGPRRAFSNVARALAWAYQTLMDSSITWRMNSVPSVWGPGHSMRARCMEGVRKAAAHCSSTVGSHSWWRTEAARFPTFGRATPRAGPHSWDWAEQAQRWGAVSGCAPQRRHVVSNTVSRWEDWCARTVIVGMLSMGCAAVWRCWSLSNQSRGSPLPDV